MKRVQWQDRAVGDIFLAAVPGGLHEGIWGAECMAHPGAPRDFQVTHVGIVGPVPGWITEAWMSIEEGIDSVASVVEDSKYTGVVGQLELWRPDATSEAVFLAFGEYLAKYVPRHYGWMNLFGFEYRAVVKRLTGKDVENPIEQDKAAVCSQGGAFFMQMTVAHGGLETWINAVDVRNQDPLKTRIDFLAHEITSA